MDTASFARAMRRVLRQDPDVILIGEMRDEETVRTALSAAETGHLVLSTVHTLDAPETRQPDHRLLPAARAEPGARDARRDAQGRRLAAPRPDADGDGRVAVCEMLRMTGRARDMIIDPEQTGRLREVIAEGEYYGMQTFDQALLRHYQAGRVSMEDAMRVASSPHDFKLLVAAEGRRSTTMDDLGGLEHSEQLEHAEQPERVRAPRAPRASRAARAVRAAGVGAPARRHGVARESAAAPMLQQLKRALESKIEMATRTRVRYVQRPRSYAGSGRCS